MNQFDDPAGVGPTRPFVPFFLNDRIYQWLFAPWDGVKCMDYISVEIPVRHYPYVKDRERWHAKYIAATFAKNTQNIGYIHGSPANARKPVVLCNAPVTNVTEIFYLCVSKDIYFNAENIPVLK